MERGDILAMAGGLILVIIIAVVLNPSYLRGTPVVPVTPTPADVPTYTPPPELTLIPDTPGTPSAEVVIPSVRPDNEPYRIFYTDQPFTFPRFKLPDNMRTFGASDIPIRNEEVVPFAYVEETRGGLTRKFSVPYPLWIINTTVIANRTPQYGNFKMVLCYGNNGTIIEGDEILNRGTSYRIIQTSGTDVYLIISTAYIDRFHITLETPRSYYSAYRP